MVIVYTELLLYRILLILIRNIYFIIKRLDSIMYVLYIRYARTLEFLEF